MAQQINCLDHPMHVRNVWIVASLHKKKRKNKTYIEKSSLELSTLLYRFFFFFLLEPSAINSTSSTHNGRPVEFFLEGSYVKNALNFKRVKKNLKILEGDM